MKKSFITFAALGALALAIALEPAPTYADEEPVCSGQTIEDVHVLLEGSPELRVEDGRFEGADARFYARYLKDYVHFQGGTDWIDVPATETVIVLEWNQYQYQVGFIDANGCVLNVAIIAKHHHDQVRIAMNAARA